MVLTWRRGIFHRTLKAEQLIVSSWMSNGGLRRSVSCKKKRERERRQADAGSEFGGFWKYFPLVWHQAELFTRMPVLFEMKVRQSVPAWELKSLRPYWWKQRDCAQIGPGLKLHVFPPGSHVVHIRGGGNEVNRWKWCFLSLQECWWYILWGLEWHFRRLCLGFQWPMSTWEASCRIYTGVGVRSSTPLDDAPRDRVQWWSLSMFLLFPLIFVVIPAHTHPTSCADLSSVRGVSPLHLQPLLPSDWSEWFDMSAEFPPPSPRGRGPVNQNLRIKAEDLNLSLIVYAGARVPP